MRGGDPVGRGPLIAAVMPLHQGAVMRILLAILAFGLVCFDAASNSPWTLDASSSAFAAAPKPRQTLLEARRGFVTKVVRSGESAAAPEKPAGDEFALIRFQSPVGLLSAYVTPNPGDGKKHPAIVWIAGGDNNSIGDVWSAQDRGNDQTASAFRKAGVVMMFPSQRGGNDNPGKREGFYGEVDDILAATDHLAKLPYVDSDQIYLGGHSTGGTMAMLVGACSDRYRAIFSLGPVAAAGQYGGDYVYCDPNNQDEMRLRSPIFWLHCVKSPMYVFDGENGNWDGAIKVMADENSNPNIQFYRIAGHDHFSAIAPLVEKLADQVVSGKVNVTQQTIQGLR
jgi:dienelactone hydrolase